MDKGLRENLKHTTSYNLDNCNVENLIKQFNQYLN